MIGFALLAVVAACCLAIVRALELPPPLAATELATERNAGSGR